MGAKQSRNKGSPNFFTELPLDLQTSLFIDYLCLSDILKLRTICISCKLLIDTQSDGLWKRHFAIYYPASFVSSIISDTPYLKQFIKLSKQEKTPPKLDKRLFGHGNRILSMEWSRDGSNFVSLGARDGRFFLTSAETGKLMCRFPLLSSSQMSCAISPSGQFVACGGLDNISTIYSVQNQAHTAVLSGHSGWIATNRFVSDENVLTASGDCSCVLWDVPKQTQIRSFVTNQTTCDAFALRVHPYDPNTFLSGYVTNKESLNLALWDTRIDTMVHSWDGNSDVNDIAYSPNGVNFVTASDDGNIRYYDLRNFKMQSLYAGNESATCVGYNITGKTVFVGAGEKGCLALDAYGNKRYAFHNVQVLCLGVSRNGILYTGGSDHVGRVSATF